MKNKLNIKSISSIAIHVLYVVIILILAWHVNFLFKEVDFLNRQSLWFNGRTNNLEGCWKNQDFECPENKYFDASQFMQGETQ
jgi:hypothetical protein